MNATQDPIARFLASPAYGVVGASPRRHKYGNKVLRCYQQNGRRAIPVNPREPEIEGVACVASVLDLPDDVQSISIITPPQVTERVVEQAIRRASSTSGCSPARRARLRRGLPGGRHQRHRGRQLRAGRAGLPGAMKRPARSRLAAIANYSSHVDQ